MCYSMPYDILPPHCSSYQGIHPKVVQERLGHATISMTLDTYSHLIPSMGRDAADRLDQLLA